MRRVFFLFTILVVPLWSKPLDVKVSASSAVLMNADTGAILYEKQGSARSFPASTTKIATALYVLDRQIPLDKMVTVSEEALKRRPHKGDEFPAHWLDSDGTLMGLLKGEKLSLENLLYGMMLVSGNDAGNAVAEAVSGSVPAFMNELNEYLQKIGCKNTHFCNPHGRHHSEHYTTAYELAVMTQRAIQIGKFRDIISAVTYQKPKTNKQPAKEITANNPMLKPSKPQYYPKIIGGKTGFTCPAKNNLVAVAEQEGRTLIAVILGCEQRSTRYQDAIRLFEMAFAENKHTRRLLGPETLFTKEIEGAKSSLTASLAKELTLEFFPSEEPECKAFIHWNPNSLPIQKGQKVGEVQIMNAKGDLLLKQDLLASSEVKPQFLSWIKDRISHLVRK